MNDDDNDDVEELLEIAIMASFGIAIFILVLRFLPFSGH